MKYFFIFCIILSHICLANPQFQFNSYETDNLRLIYYDSTHRYVIPHLRRCFENSFGFYRKLFNYKPSEKVTVFFQDFDDYGYAGATAQPINYMILGIEPFEYVYETSPTNERLNWVTMHELMHVVSMDKATKTDEFYRSLLFGKVTAIPDNPLSMIYGYLTTPRKYCPRWFLEGIAVFMETQLSGGIGRAQGGWDEMVFRSMVRDSSYFYDVVGLESEGTTIDFQVGENSYLYGTRFMSYLVYKYGIEKLLSWSVRTEGSTRDFASEFSRIYGTSLDDEWSKWTEWEHTWQEMNLDSIRAYPVTPFRYMSKDALGAVSRSYYDSVRHCIYAAVNYPGQLAYIVSVDIYTGHVERICNMPTPGLYNVCFLAYDQKNGQLFYTTNNIRSWRALNVVDIQTHESKRLFRGSRTGDIVFNQNDGSIWGIEHNIGYSSIVRFAPPYDKYIRCVTLEYGKDFFDIDISPDGKYLIGTLMEISGDQRLVRMATDELMRGEGFAETLWEFVMDSTYSSPMNFTYSADGRYLYGSTYFTGVSNIVRYDFETKNMEWLTNCETGLFRPIPLSKDSVFAYRYSGKGFIPVIFPDIPTDSVKAVKYLGADIRRKYPIVQTWKLPSPLTINIDSLTTFAGQYHGIGSLRLFSAYPIVDGYKDFAAFGYRFNLMEPLFLHEINLAATYTPNRILPPKERMHLEFSYSYWQWKLSASYNRSDFYDLFGPTKTSRKGYSVGLEYSHNILYDLPQVMEYSVGLSGWGGLEKLPDYQNISASYDKYLTGNVKLSYRNLRRSLGGIETEGGFRAQFYTLDNYVNGHHFPRLFSTADYGFLLPIYHSSIWLRSSAGYSFGDIDEPFANFYFGGFGNNWIDYQDAKRYRSYYSFPGAELNSIGGTNYAKVMLEWALPPIRYRRFGFLNLFCNWSHITLFSTGIVTNIGKSKYRQICFNVGSQIDFKIVLVSKLEATFSMGYALAWERYQHPTDEFMISLKIL
jgi:hypothetical protein